MNITIYSTEIQIPLKQPQLTKKFHIGNNTLIPLEILGEGSYGSVYKVRHIHTNQYYAIKILKNLDNSDGIPITSLREIILLKFLDHPNIIKLEQIDFNKGRIELCLEYCQFDLLKFINLYKNNSEIYTLSLLKKFMFQILTGVSFLHSHKIMHRDLKPGNIMINENNLLKIGDFGLSRIFSISKRKYTKEVSTLWYRSPELLLGLEDYGIELDMWAIGCIFGELLIKKPLFIGDSERSQLDAMFSVFGTFNDELLPGFQFFPKYTNAFNQYKGIGLKNYLKQYCEFELDENCLNLIEGLLKINPRERILCKEALENVSNFEIYLYFYIAIFC